MPGRKRTNLYEKKPAGQEEVERRKEKVAEKKNWSGKLVTVNAGIFEFVGRHAKESKRYIEATYT